MKSVVSIVLLSSTSAFSQGLVLDATSSHGVKGTLHFATSSISRSTKTAVLCTNSHALLKKAVLWMPSMGHGSAPTTVSAVSAQCFQISNMQFIMAGDWEVRAQFNTGDSMIFAFDVAR